MPTPVSVLIVTWNSAGWLSRCLEGIPPEVEVVVLDNGSTDGTPAKVAELCPRARVLQESENVGLAAGINRAVSAAAGEYLLLLNPDAEVTPRAVERLRTFLDEHPRCGAVSGRLVSLREQPQRAMNIRRFPTLLSIGADLLLISRLFPNNPVTRRAYAAELDDLRPAPIEQTAVSCLMLRRATFEQVGGMDEQFFPAWFEDADLCKRVRRAGWTIYYVPNAVFRHVAGQSAGVLGREQQLRFWHRNLERYARKHHGRAGWLLVTVMARTGLLLRMLGATLKGDLASARIYRAVFADALGNWRHTATPIAIGVAETAVTGRQGSCAS